MATEINLGLAVFAGILTAVSPCILPVLPIIVGRSLATHRAGPLFLIAGLVAGFAVAGSLIGITAQWLGGLMAILRNVSIALLLGLGLLTIFPNWSYRFFGALPIQRWIKEPKQVGLWGEFLLGSQLGLLWTPCAGPVLSSILLLSVNQNPGQSFGLLIAYGVGAALPMLAIAYGGQAIAQRLLKLRGMSSQLMRIGGGLIILTAIAIFLGWDVQIQLLLAPLFPSQML
jgi:cytochrome c-type biogenesis protein